MANMLPIHKSVKSSNNLPSWRINKTTMTQKWAAVLASNIPGIDHDVKFLIGENQELISCHKLVLSVCSPVFQAMFDAPFKSEEAMNPIKIPDVHFNGMTNVLKDALTTMYAANKYDIPEMVDHCSSLLKSNLSIDNAVIIYQSAVLLNDTDLMNKAQNFIVNDFGNIMATNGFLEFKVTNLIKFIQMDELEVYNEIELFKGIMKWGKHQIVKNGNQGDLKDAIKDLVKHIRFPMMTALEFTEVDCTGILPEKDCYNMFKYFSLPESERYSLTMNYNTKIRMVEIEVMLWNRPISYTGVNYNDYYFETLRRKETREESFLISPTSSNSSQSPFYSSFLYDTNVNRRCKVMRLKGICLLAPESIATRKYLPGYYGNVNDFYVNNINIVSSSRIRGLGGNVVAENKVDETATFLSTVIPGEMYEVEVKKPMELLPNHEYSFSFKVEYIKAIPADINNQLTSATAASAGKPDGSTCFNIQHTGGHYIVAAMKILL